MSPPVLIVFCHLRWDFVFQRPQQLLSRLAGRWRVLFVEPPLLSDGPPRIEVRERAPLLDVLVPHLPQQTDGFADAERGPLPGLLADELGRRQAQPVAVAWLYAPAALPLARALRPDCLVYDCIDRPPPGARGDAADAALLREATLVLTAGPSLYDALHGRHPQVWCLPSAVDAAHFAGAGLRPGCRHERQARRLQAQLPAPRLGYFGVVDERLDFELIAALADARPEASIVMAGPIALADAARLPRRPNLHWLGAQPYQRLPYLLAGWDLCLVPFALTEATRYINPTKTLEYMAGDKPVVATAVPDVEALYGEAVVIARSQSAFVQACAELLVESPAARCRRAIEMLNTVSMHSWDRSAECVHKLLARACAGATPARPRLPARIGAVAAA